MITPSRKHRRFNVKLVESLPLTKGWTPVLNRHGISYCVKGVECAVTIDDWLIPEYLEQANELSIALGLPSAGPTPASTAMRIFRSLLSSPVGQSHSFSKILMNNRVNAGGRAEVGAYGHWTGDMVDVDFRAAYGTLLCEGPGDLERTNVPLADADFVDATVRDVSPFPVTRYLYMGRDFFATGECRRILTKQEFDLTEAVMIHCTYRLQRRADIARFATTLIAMRDSYPVAKLLICCLVGRLAIETTERPAKAVTPRSGDTYVAPGIWSTNVPTEPRGATHVYSFITGTCRGHLASLLNSCTNAGGIPLTWDTDGALLFGWEPAGDTWGPFRLKKRPCSEAYIWASKISALMIDNAWHVRAGGLPADPPLDTLRMRLHFAGLEDRLVTAGPVLTRASDGSILGRWTRPDGTTRPYVGGTLL